MQQLLGGLSPELKQVALLKLEGYQNAEVAVRLGCSLPTVERKLRLIRRLWTRGPQRGDRIVADSSNLDATLGTTVVLRIDAICDAFEAAWKPNPPGRPRLEDFLVQAPDDERGPLLAKLLPVDLSYRCWAGESPTEATTARGFPNHGSLIEHAMHKLDRYRLPQRIDGYRILRGLGRRRVSAESTWRKTRRRANRWR